MKVRLTFLRNRMSIWTGDFRVVELAVQQYRQARRTVTTTGERIEFASQPLDDIVLIQPGECDRIKITVLPDQDEGLTSWARWIKQADGSVRLNMAGVKPDDVRRFDAIQLETYDE